MSLPASNNSAVSALKANDWYEQDAHCFYESHFFCPVCYFYISKCILSNIMWFLQSILNHMVWMVSKGTTKFQRKSLPLLCGLQMNSMSSYVSLNWYEIIISSLEFCKALYYYYYFFFINTHGLLIFNTLMWSVL